MERQEDNMKMCLMSLLYIQTKEVELLYNNNIVNEKNYYLVDKEWLNKFKQSYNYDNAAQQLQNIQYVNYDNLKEKFCNQYQIDKSQLINNIENLSMNQEYLCKRYQFTKDNINISYPVEFQLVKEEFFTYYPKNRLDDSPIYKILIGNKSIVIFDNKMENVAFVYSIFEDEIKIRGILVYNSQQILEKEKKIILDLNVIDNYFNNRKLDETKKEIQKIIDRDEELGYFYSLHQVDYYKGNLSINEFYEAMKQSNNLDPNERNNLNPNNDNNDNNDGDEDENSNEVDSFSIINNGNKLSKEKVNKGNINNEQSDSKLDIETNEIDGFSNINPGNEKPKPLSERDNKNGKAIKKSRILFHIQNSHEKQKNIQNNFQNNMNINNNMRSCINLNNNIIDNLTLYEGKIF
jgi:hypothetical protein